ncbi:hypothetical protein [Zunongwangia endophytica]|uniref:Sialate O-acetylesterase n=1 Tax=Zunongwangia endophytica TaxID=1808945 RepID=A0ABV8HBS6_9FLAO|nr:hypothetical protein [Zunongwangia endophytica]MDN3593487.1 hypothetical protein [Zunongwangia endophytica]
MADRLARAAKHTAYGETSVVGSGPIYKSSVIKSDTIILSFENVGSGLQIKDGNKLGGFAIAGKDQNFVWAEATLKGDKIMVFSPDIKKPVAVRYGWADNPDKANLYNKEGLPASPFRTDTWPSF